MSRPRLTNLHLPKYVTVIEGSYWYRPPGGPNVRIGPAGEEHLVWKFMLDKTVPAAPAPKGSELRVYFDKYAQEVLPHKSERTQQDYNRSLAILRKVFGHMRPEEVLPEHIGQFLSSPPRGLTGNGAGGLVQANHHIAVLSSVYTMMIGRWFVTRINPCANVLRNTEQPRGRAVSDADFKAVYDLAPPTVQVAMDLALLTGQREGDLLKMHFRQVLPDGVYVEQGKGRGMRKRLIEMSPALRAVLDRARKINPAVDIGGYVLRTQPNPITGDLGGNRITVGGFQAIWRRARAKALKAGTLTESFNFHDIRAKTVSDSADIDEASLRAGHTSVAITKRVYDRGVRRVKPLR